MAERDSQPGLRKRLAIEGRRIVAQHEQLRDLWRQVMSACEERDLSRIQRTFGNLVAGLCAHFDLEERVQIPALHGSDPSTDQKLIRLIEQHSEFRVQLEAASAVLDAGDIDSLAAAFRSLTVELAAHEEVEESLFPVP